MQGRRIYNVANDNGPDAYYADAAMTSPPIRYADLKPGDYWIWRGFWHATTPNGMTCGLAKHQVTEHDDGTITVSPSILVNDGTAGHSWHGFLERGIWREC